MKVVAARVDERLVHGQIMTSWSKHLALKRIVVIDNQVAKDEFMAEVLKMSAPSGLAIDILSVADAGRLITEDTGEENTLLLFKGIGAALELAQVLKDGPHKMTELNIGNLGSIPGRIQVTKNVFLSDAEKDQIRELQKMGVNVFLQMLYTDPRTEASEII